MSSYIFSYKKSFAPSKMRQYSFKNSNNDISMLLFDFNDLEIEENNQTTISAEIIETIFKEPFVFTWDRLKEIDWLYKNKMYKSALILALTIPDICSKIFYPNENQSVRYEKWFNKNVYDYEQGTHGKNNKNFDCFNGHMCYMLRNALVHGDTNDISNLANSQDSSFIKKGYKKVIFALTDMPYSYLFVFNDEKNKSCIIFHSIKSIIYCIIRTAETIYKEELDKTKFHDGCEIFKFDEYELQNNILIRKDFVNEIKKIQGDTQ